MIITNNKEKKKWEAALDLFKSDAWTIGDYWKKEFKDSFRRYQKFLSMYKFLFRLIAKNSSLLEFHCIDALAVNIVSEHAMNYIGIVENEALQSEIELNINLEKASVALEIPRQIEKKDVILSIDNPKSFDEVIALSKKHLKPDGKLIISFQEKENFVECSNSLRRFFKQVFAFENMNGAIQIARSGSKDTCFMCCSLKEER